MLNIYYGFSSTLRNLIGVVRYRKSKGNLFQMQCLINCCCRRKTFLTSQLHCIRAPCLLMALREDPACQEVLLAMLEMDVEKDRDYQLQMISTLQSTSSGKHKYAALCERQIVLRELQQRGGPRKLTLPSKSTVKPPGFPAYSPC